MKFQRLCIALFTCVFLLGTAGQLFADTTFIRYGMSWKYLDKGIEAPTGKGAADWRNLTFNDGSWKSGPAEFGYGGNRERTTIQFGPDAAHRYITTYFRRTVSLPSLSTLKSVRINAYVDDGAVVYVNGLEAGRINFTGAAAYNTLASPAEDNGNVPAGLDLPVALFKKGRNIVAVELHQASADSPDLGFDLELIGRTSVADENTVVRGPYLQMVNGNAVTIRWTTALPGSSRVQFGSNENTLTSTVSKDSSQLDHEIRLTGLQPDTRYYYSIGTKNEVLKGSYRNYFTTAPPIGTKRKIRIGVFGDPGTGTIRQKSTRDSYLQLKGGYQQSEMVIMLGDNAYSAGTEAEHNNHFFAIYNNNVFDNNVIFPVPGNHEYANDRNRALDHDIPYYRIFSVPANGECGGVPSGTRHYYSYDYGNIHFIMLDSYGIDGGSKLYDDTANGPQAVWLKADLQANAGKHKWTIACLHHPPYTNGSHVSDKEFDLTAIRQKITPILERYGVDVVLAGHSHVYERSFLIKDHTGLSTRFNTDSVGGGEAISRSSARYDGSAPVRKATADSNTSVSSCPYFTIDSNYQHGTVYVVAGSAGQVNANSTNNYPVFYTRNQSNSAGGETGMLYLEIEDNRLDAKFIGGSGTIRDRFTIMKGVNRKTAISTQVSKAAVLTASWIGSYSWAGAGAESAVNNQRQFSVKPAATGTYMYYVYDSIQTGKTCISDTFTLQVTSAMASSVTAFSAEIRNSKVLLQWTAANAEASDYFTVERSDDGQNYEAVMAISAQGKSPADTRYEFIDNDAPAHSIQYRLIATDRFADRKLVGTRTVTVPGR